MAPACLRWGTLQFVIFATIKIVCLKESNCNNKKHNPQYILHYNII
jgi:hypothetical protein